MRYLIKGQIANSTKVIEAVNGEAGLQLAIKTRRDLIINGSK